MKRVGIPFLLSVSFLFLAGCTEGEEMLQKVSTLIEQQFDFSSENEGEENERELEMENLTMEQEQEEGLAFNNDGVLENDENEIEKSEGMSNNSTLTFDEKLEEKGYERLDPPNGLPIPMHESWILIEERMEDPIYEGTFVFDTPIEEVYTHIEDILETEGYQHTSEKLNEGKNVYETEFSFTEESYRIKGSMIYFIDDMELTYVKVNVTIE